MFLWILPTVLLSWLTCGEGLRESCAEYGEGCLCSVEEVICRDAGLGAVPEGVPEELRVLDLTGNNITELTRISFNAVPNLVELDLSRNPLELILPSSFDSLTSLRRLTLSACGIRHLPSHALRTLTTLHYLNLNNNHIVDVEYTAFQNLRSLKVLSMNGNALLAIPTEASGFLTRLEELYFNGNLITEINEETLPELLYLKVLSLRKNRITLIEDSAFSKTTSLRLLELDDNILFDIPQAIASIKHLEELSLSNNRISTLRSNILQRCSKLALLELRGNPVHEIENGAFDHLPSLKKLTLSDARHLSVFPSFNGTSSLETLRIDRCSLDHIPDNLCHYTPRLKTLDVKSNKLKRISDLSHCRDLRVLDFSSNRIESLEGRLFKGLGKLHDLLLAHNLITSIPRDAFHGLDSLQLLDLDDNRIEFIHEDAFLSISKIEDLNVANNYFPYLPPTGLQRVLHLKTYNNPNLKEFHQPDVFPRIQTLVLSYAYHCCAYMPIMEESRRILELTGIRTPLREAVYYPKEDEFDKSLWSENLTDSWPSYANISKIFGNKIKNILESLGPEFTYPDKVQYVSPYEYTDDYLTADYQPRNIQCLPMPGPFLPCQDLFDWWTLRCGVWVVFLMAMLGNGTVVFVLVFSRSKMDVPRFLVCNLAAADFFMGVYLGLLAVVDASTLGEFRKYAIAWQMSPACRLAGFLGVLSSELSVYTLAVITLERNYAITHAMHLNKRLSLRHAAYVMLVGWTFSLVCATLPLVGISDYRKFAVCLPFEVEGTASLSYVVFLMLANGVAFLVLMGCYLKMYCAIRGSQAWNSNDSRIAKRMALLVFTDFLCWSPIAFFSLTAMFGLRLVSLEQAKVFTVFVLPLNSCCNPFLYAILTKQFKKDCVMICKAIEESRVTRGIGRCRHSSNFSNRQTPANTDSLNERSSRQQHAPHCACRARLIEPPPRILREPAPRRVLRWLKSCGRGDMITSRRTGSGAEVARPRSAVETLVSNPRGANRGSSVSSSENLSSSRSDSWRTERAERAAARAGVRAPRRTAQWLAARKTSQDSTLSSSRNDSSGSATTASTGTWRTSRSSSGRPRLTRQLAVLADEPPSSPGRLAVRFLATIPSAAETSVQLDEL